jgi:quercetin dioxygenase-like cupin family protein
MNLVHLGEMAEFHPDAHVGRVVHEQGHIKALLVCLEAGQRIPPCRMDYDVAFYVIEGDGRIWADGTEGALATGTLAVVPAGAERSIAAGTRMRVLAIQAR